MVARRGRRFSKSKSWALASLSIAWIGSVFSVLAESPAWITLSRKEPLRSAVSIASEKFLGFIKALNDSITSFRLLRFFL